MPAKPFPHPIRCEFSPCRRWRYVWETTWAEGQRIAFIGLNPSTADENGPDPTVLRCVKRAKVLGYGSMVMLNVFGWRDTDPEGMKRQDDPVGELNDFWIREQAFRSDTILCCWGKHGRHRGGEIAVLDMLRVVHLHCLGVNQDGTPKHPLYLPYETKPIMFREMR